MIRYIWITSKSRKLTEIFILPRFKNRPIALKSSGDTTT